MKKIFSLLAAVLFAGSMMAVNFTLSSADAVTVDGVTVTFAKGAGSTNPTWYSNGLRLYANNTVTVSSESAITAITFNWQQQGTKAFNTATASVGEYTHPEAAGEGKWTGSANSVTFTLGASGQLLLNTFTVTLAEGGEPVEPGDEPSVLQAVSDSTTWDFSKITANTENALYGNDGIHLTDESEPSKNDKVIYADYSADFMTIGEEFNKAAIAFKGEYPIRKNQYCQAGTLHFRAAVPGTIVVKFSDTGSSASATAVKRYLVVNDVQTEYWTSRENNGETPYDAQLNVVSGEIAVPAGDVTITGSSAIVMYYVTFVPAQAIEPEGPQNLGAKTIAEFLALKNTTDTCILTGVVSNIVNTTYGNFDLIDATDTVYVYGLLTPAGESQKFADLNVAENDTLTVLAIYNEYKGKPQAKNAIFVSVKKSSAPVVEPQNLGAKTIAEFLALKNTKDTCILTGVVSNIVNNVYGNFDLIDATDTVYVYGLLTPAGESQKFADLNVAEKDTLTVLAIYNEYKGKPQAKNAIFVSVKKAPKAPAQDIEITLSSLTNPGALIWTDYVAEEGWWQIMGANEAFDFSISNVSTTETAGVYTVADLDANYSYIDIYGENDTTEVTFVDGSVTVAVSAEGIVTVNGTLVGSDGNNYIFNLTYKDPTADNTVNVAISEWELVDDYVAYLGLFAVAGEDANGTYVQLALNMPEGATEIAGDYTEEDFDLQYFGSYVKDADGAYRIFSATIKVAQNEAGEVSVTADILCYNNTLYKVSTTFGDGIDDVNAAVKATKTLKNGHLLIEKNGRTYNVLGTTIR